jgi:hypothetical protein
MPPDPLAHGRSGWCGIVLVGEVAGASPYADIWVAVRRCTAAPRGGAYQYTKVLSPRSVQWRLGI